MRALRFRPPAWTSVLLATALLLWPALLAGRPSVFADTDGYYWLGESLAEAGLQALLRLLGDDRPLIAQGSLFAPGGVEYLNWMGARSPAYSLFLFLSQRLGGLWFAVALQALAPAWIVRALLRAALPATGERAYLGLIALLAATTSLPFFATFAMPDVFAAVGALAAALLLVYPDRLSRPTQVATWLVLAFSLSAHRSHLLAGLVLLTLAGAAIAVRAGLGFAARRCFAPAAAVAAALAVLLVYPVVVRALPGPAEVGAPPFLAARVLADGPGRAYLHAACRDGVDYALCAYRNAEMADAEDVLWSVEPDAAVVARATPAERTRMKEEELGFVLGTLRYAPLETAAAALRNFGLQLARFQVVEPLESPSQYLQGDRGAIPALLPGAAACRGINACRPPISPGLLQTLHALVVVLALAVLLGGAHRLWRSGTDEDRRLVFAAAIVLGAAVVNAALCGMLSDPTPRYQARVVWLAPALAGLFALALARRPRAAARFAPARPVEAAALSPTRI